MGDNVFVSFDEEKLMNDILDQGIDELKNSNLQAKSGSIDKTHMSNPEYDPKHDLIVNKKIANLNPNSNGSKEFSGVHANYNAERFKGSRRIDFHNDGYANQTESIIID